MRYLAVQDKPSPAPAPEPISAPQQRVVVQKRPHQPDAQSFASTPVNAQSPANGRPVYGTPGTRFSHDEGVFQISSTHPLNPDHRRLIDSCSFLYLKIFSKLQSRHTVLCDCFTIINTTFGHVLMREVFILI